MKLPPKAVKPAKEAQQEGFILLAVLFMLVLILLSLSIAAPTVATDLRRDKDQEAIQRGKQYMRAIRLYYKRFGAYPSTIDQLMNTNGQRFLRKRYLDPFTNKDDWRLIHVGEAHLSSTGFFGQAAGQQPGTPIAGSSAASAGTSSTGGSIFGGTPAGSTGASTAGSSTSIFGGSSGSTSSPFGSTSAFGSTSTGGYSGAAGGSPIGGTGSSIFGSSGSSGISGTSGTSPTGASSTGAGTGGTGSSPFGTPGATFGGAPIVGIGLPRDKTSIVAYRKQTNYKLWEFVYDPTQELAAAAAVGGAGITQTGASPGSSSPDNGTGGNSGFGSGFGSSNGFGSGNGIAGHGSMPGSMPGTTQTSPNPPTTDPGRSQN